MSLLLMWTVYAVFGVAMTSAAFIWAVRTRQFSSEQQARRVPIETPALVDDEPASGKPWHALVVPVILVSMGAGVIALCALIVYVR